LTGKKHLYPIDISGIENLRRLKVEVEAFLIREDELEI